MKMLYIVEALRGGDRERHSYVLGIWDTLEAAKEAARRHVEYRGGKYSCQVNQCQLNDEMSTDWCSALLHEENPAPDTAALNAVFGREVRGCIVPVSPSIPGRGLCDACGSECLCDEMHVIRSESLSGIVLCPKCFRK